jgi:hypothetical protein
VVSGIEARFVKRIFWTLGALLGVTLVVALRPLAAAATPKDLEKISDDLRHGRIAEAQKLCAGLPRSMYDLAARLPYNSSRVPQPSVYADVFAHCAVASLRAGDQAEASWRWSSAFAFDARTATSSALALGGFSELPAVRRAGEGLPERRVSEIRDWREVETWILGALKTDFSPDTPGRDRSRLNLRGGFKCELVLEAILGHDGRLRAPVLVAHEHCVLDQAMVILDELGRRPYEPVKSGAGEPIDVGYQLTLRDTNLRKGH